jgi:hypothetical protein
MRRIIGTIGAMLAIAAVMATSSTPASASSPSWTTMGSDVLLPETFVRASAGYPSSDGDGLERSTLPLTPQARVKGGTILDNDTLMNAGSPQIVGSGYNH